MYPSVAVLTNILADPTSGRLHKTLVRIILPQIPMGLVSNGVNLALPFLLRN